MIRIFFGVLVDVHGTLSIDSLPDKSRDSIKDIRILIDTCKGVVIVYSIRNNLIRFLSCPDEYGREKHRARLFACAVVRQRSIEHENEFVVIEDCCSQ